MKCVASGTTTLFARFLGHPELKCPDKKELHYLDRVADESYQEYLQNWNWNRKGIAQQENETQIKDVDPPEIGSLFEITPSYLLVMPHDFLSKEVTRCRLLLAR